MTNKRTLNLEGLNLFCYSSVHQKRSEAEFSCVSMRSEASMGCIIKFKSGDTETDLRYVFMFSASEIKVCVHFIIQLLCVYKYTYPCIHVRKNAMFTY